MSTTKKVTTTVVTKTNAPAPKSKVFDPKNYERPGLTIDTIMDVKVAFDLFDTDGGGSIDPKGTDCCSIQSSRLP